ncbi:MAG: gliding motility protein GldN [Bacteroidales bacterium]
MYSLLSHNSRTLFALALAFACTLAAVAQPPARRKAAENKEQTAAQTAPKGSAYRDFPTAAAMPEDVSWRRDIYRSLDLTKDANAPLYYPTTPTNGRENLFTYLFKLLLRGQVKAYDYKLDGNEDFSEKNIVKAKELMDRYHIFYEQKDGKIRVTDSDLPSDEVKVYFIKESTYFDQHTATIRKKVTALCPVLKRGDDFGGADSQYPMFWVKMDDVAPYLGKLMLMGSNLNNAAMMSADDFFTLNRYEGDIYKTVNLQDRILANYCTEDSAMKKEQARIEKELDDFDRHVWGKDSVAPDTIRVTLVRDTTATVTKTPARRRTSSTSRRSSVSSKSSSSSRSSSKSASSKSTSTKKAKTPKTRKPSTSSRSGGGYSVRRERH